MKKIWIVLVAVMMLPGAFAAKDANDKSLWHTLVVGDPLLRSWRQQLSAQHELVESLGEDKRLSEKKGHLVNGFNLNLVLGASGKLGLLNFGGTASTELFWRRRPQAAKPEYAQGEPDELNADLAEDKGMMSEYETVAQLVREAALQHGLSAEAAQTLDMSAVFEAIARHQDWAKKLVSKSHDWRVDRVAFELELAFSVAPGTVFVSVGGDARIRLTWKVSSPANKSDAPADAAIESHGYRLSYLRLGVGGGVGGDIGVASAEAQSMGYVYLVPVAAVKQDAANKGRKNPWERAINKALKKAHKLTKRAQKYGNPKSKWGLKTIRSSFEASVSGDVALVELSGGPNVEINFERIDWGRTPKLATDDREGAEAAQTRLNGMRIRTRAKLAVGLGTLAKAELRPFVEWHLKR